MKNDYEIRGDVTAIFVDSPKYGRREVLIDTSDLPRAKEFPNSWCIAMSDQFERLRVVGHLGKGPKKILSRWLFDLPESTLTCFKNGDNLDNTRSNIITSNKPESNQNRRGASKNNKSSGIRGVYWNKKNEKWEAKIMVNYKNIFLGCYSSIHDAEKSVKKARSEYMTHSLMNE